ncbi:MAG: hypothetical protein RIC55_15075 [Pirellulaceae bacterium]
MDLNPYESPKHAENPSPDEPKGKPRQTWGDMVFIALGVAALATFAVNVWMKVS